MQAIITRIFSVIVALMTMLGLIQTPANSVKLDKTEQDPYIFVHGLMGWGDISLFNDVYEYWGGDRNIPKLLNELGAQVKVADIGGISSAWDRACELYAHITGTRVDYGAAHSAKYGHARYGKTYEKALIENWDEGGKINLIGHSFGGATVRLFSWLLANGSAQEQVATPNGLSPLFSGQNAGRIHSITTLSAPHNGTTFGCAVDTSADSRFREGLFTFYSVYGNSGLRCIRDPMLEQWGITVAQGEESWSALDRAKIEKFIQSDDNAFHDLSVTGAAEVNAAMGLAEGIYYYSYYACATKADGSGNQVFLYPNHPFALTGNLIGSLKGEFDGVTIDESWFANDGLVNVISSHHPFGEPAVDFNAANQVRNVWQVMPELTGWMHTSFMMANHEFFEDTTLVDFYISHMNIVTGTGV